MYGPVSASFALLGVCLHPISKRWEPNIVRFLGLVFLSTIATCFYLVYGERCDWLGAMGLTLRAMGSCLSGLCCSIVAYRLSPLHPLAGYPGPILAKISKWWMACWIAKGERHLLLQRLHAQYGPWLRIGPNEISVNDPAALRPIYGTMFRAPFYQTARKDADALVTTVDQVEHARRRIAWDRAFSTESLRGFRDMAELRTNQLLGILQAKSKHVLPIDLSHWLSLWSMDNMGDMSFSGGFETLAAGKDMQGWMEMFSLAHVFVGIVGQTPWMHDIIMLLPQPGPIVTFQKFIAQKVLSTRATSVEAKRDILGIIQDESSGGPLLTSQEAAADAALMITAGTSTVSEGATTLFRHIIGNEKIQTRLRAEISATFDTGEYCDPVRLTQLPYLDACVQEALRIVPPGAPAGAPRFSGNGGQILDQYIPGGTTVACPTYTLQRDPQNFARPDEFIPERWLPESAIKPHVPEAFHPFSYGPGVCVGKPVALYNMKLLTIRMLQKFQFSFASGFDPRKFDASYKDRSTWEHDPLMVQVEELAS